MTGGNASPTLEVILERMNLLSENLQSFRDATEARFKQIESQLGNFSSTVSFGSVKQRSLDNQKRKNIASKQRINIHREAHDQDSANTVIEVYYLPERLVYCLEELQQEVHESLPLKSRVRVNKSQVVEMVLSIGLHEIRTSQERNSFIQTLVNQIHYKSE